MDNIQLVCKLNWVPPYINARDRFAPEISFRTYGVFTSDFEATYTVEVRYSKDCVDGFHTAILEIPFADANILKRLSRQTNIILMDSYRVIAVCKEITIKN